MNTTDNNTLGARLLAWRQSQKVRCATCAGTGWKANKIDYCPACEGTGATAMTQVQAGERTAVGYSNWRNWEKGRRVPSRGTLAHLESVLADNTTTKQ